MTALDEGESGRAAPPAEPAREICAHQCSPDKTVFTEAGNTDGWIATDHTEPLER
ncbi:MAG: hypothetical protein V5A55_11620 [Halovenus sp.]